MMIKKFPPVHYADENGLLLIGGDLQVDSILLAYKNGIFPWPISEELPLAWFSPDPRGVIDFEDFHISTSLKKCINKGEFKICYNTDFYQVIVNCARVKRPSQNETWITKKIIDGFFKLYQAGYAYSVESYYQDKLVGGIYGVCIDGITSGESMFFYRSNASKVALVHLIDKLKASGIRYLDTQMISPVISYLGGKNISREQFINRLKFAPKVSVKDIFS